MSLILHFHVVTSILVIIDHFSINSQSSSSRTIAEIKKKWSDLKMVVKRKERERLSMASKTGGGPAPTNIDSLDEKVFK